MIDWYAVVLQIKLFHAFRKLKWVGERSSVAAIGMATTLVTSTLVSTAVLGGRVAVWMAVNWLGDDFVSRLLVILWCQGFQSNNRCHGQGHHTWMRKFLLEFWKCKTSILVKTWYVPVSNALPAKAATAPIPIQNHLLSLRSFFGKILLLPIAIIVPFIIIAIPIKAPYPPFLPPPPKPSSSNFNSLCS